MPVAILPLPPERQQAAVRLREAAAAQDVAAGVVRERERVLSILAIAAQAAALGVHVDLLAAINDGAEPDELRARVLEIASHERKPQ